MGNKICSFAGHSKIYNTDNLTKQIYKLCEKLIEYNGVKTFQVGNYGNFDFLAANVIQKLKEKHLNVELNLVIPYITTSIEKNKDFYYKNYDSIIIPDITETTPSKFKIIKCNQQMIDNSEYLIAYVNHSFGGAAITLEYAKKKKNIEIINLGDLQIQKQP